MQELNVIIYNENIYSFHNIDMEANLFNDEECERVDDNCDMYDLLVILGAFSSKSEARKNWTRTGKEIPSGYNEFKNIGKLNRALYIWNPIREEVNNAGFLIGTNKKL